MSDETQGTQMSGVINPYALAELILGEKIPWAQIDDPRSLLEEVLQTPYQELFDPRNDSPLYLGLELNDKLELVPSQPDNFATRPAQHVEQVTDADSDPVELARIQPRFDQPEPLNNMNRVIAGATRARSVLGELGASPATLLARYIRSMENTRLVDNLAPKLRREVRQDILELVVHKPSLDPHADWNPPSVRWGDYGRFFNEAAEFFDPIQGAVANCYLIAALSAVAWARPYMIMNMTRATGLGQQEFTNKITFHDTNSGASADTEVTDAIPLQGSSGNPIYARSSEAEEIWPAVYEKAFAKWKTGNPGDDPDITATAWGDCVRAAGELTGLKRYYYQTWSLSGADLWQKVRENSLSYRTFNPMVAATYSTGDQSPDKVIYSDANLVASHCYTVLGWEYRNDTRYIILRNPWGQTEATLNVFGGTVLLYDISWWRPIALTDPDGVFAIEADTFKKYFAVLGVVK